MTYLRKETYWSKYARCYDDYAEYVVGKPVRDAIIRRLSEERDLGEVIEFGCGTGFFTKALSPHAEHILATDLSEEMIEVARVNLKEYRNITLQKSDCESSHFAPETCDTLFMANVLHTLEDPLRALGESYRILRERGLLLIVSYTDFGMNWLERIALGMRYLFRFGIPPSYGLKNFSPQELSSLLRRAGFTVEQIQLIGDGPSALYARGRK